MSSISVRTDAVVIYVEDQDRAVRFYKSVFGFEVVLDNPIDGSDERWIEMGLPEEPVTLVLSSESGAQHFNQSIGGWTNLIFSVEGDDFEEAVREMGEAGADVVEGPESLEWGEWAIVADPDGNLFGLSSRQSNDS
jgi:predicted enzyme related to lactoylglutathione lyase